MMARAGLKLLSQGPPECVRPLTPLAPLANWAGYGGVAPRRGLVPVAP